MPFGEQHADHEGDVRGTLGSCRTRTGRAVVPKTETLRNILIDLHNVCCDGFQGQIEHVM